jgi:hypothetical protein
MIPTNGSTISVYVDGVNIGHPTYNLYRSDIATFFPGYANSNGAVGFFTLDTTKYTDGIHTINWLASDNAANTDGIGSRFFTVLNAAQSAAVLSVNSDSTELLPGYGPVSVKKGFNDNIEPTEIHPDEKGMINIEIKELERVEIHFNEGSTSNLSPLPIGSTLDTEKGVFYWQPCAGFIGDYEFVFVTKDPSGSTTQKKIQIRILPKF